MPELEPITREEKFLNGEVGMTPITREEKILAGEDVETITRREYFLKKYRGGGGGDVTVVPLSVTENGTYSEEGKAYSPVQVSVPAPVLKTKSITENGTYNASDDNADGYSSVDVDVPLPQNAYLLKSVTTPTPIASFNDGANLPMPSLKVAIEPVQSGSGDPSPTNIRPISGWDEVDVTRCGKNLFDESIFLECSGWTVSNGVYSGDTAQVNAKYGNGVPNLAFKPNTRYTFSFTYGQDGSAGIGLAMAIRYTDDTTTQKYCTLDTIGFVSITSTAGKSIKRLELSYGANRTIHLSNMQLEEGSTATTYEPYNGHTYTIDLDGTRYGGEVDVVSGEDTDRLGYVDLGTLTWTAQTDSQGTYFRSSKPNNMKSVQSGVIPDVLCSIYPITTSSNVYDGSIAFSVGSEGYTFVRDTRFTDATAFKTAMNGVQLVYELATPLTIQLTPTAVKSLLGSNNVWADTGDITDAEYFSKEV